MTIAHWRIDNWPPKWALAFSILLQREKSVCSVFRNSTLTVGLTTVFQNTFWAQETSLKSIKKRPNGNPFIFHHINGGKMFIMPEYSIFLRWHRIIVDQLHQWILSPKVFALTHQNRPNDNFCTFSLITVGKMFRPKISKFSKRH